jgi:integrase
MYPDGDGLYLQVSRNQAKSWIFRFKYGFKDAEKRRPRERQMGLGSCRYISLKEAREAVVDARRLLLAGLDPIEQRRKDRAQHQQSSIGGKTFREVARSYINEHEAGWRNPKHAQQWTNTLERYAYPKIGNLPVQDIQKTLVLEILEPIWKTKNETARRVRGRIEAILDFAKARDWYEGENPARWAGNLKEALADPSKIQRVQHHPALPYKDVAAFVGDLRQQEGVAAAGLELLILTAARTKEIREAQWSEIDLEQKVWTIPADRMKADKEHRVPLTDAAMAVIERMQSIRQSDYVFPGGRHGKPMSENAMLALLRRMGRDDITAHGFRSTFRDWVAEQTSYPNHVAEQALAHTIGNAVEAAYRRGDLFDKRRQMMDEWAARCFS